MRLTRCTVVVAFLAALGADWKDKPFPNWSEDTVLRLLTDSPWARPRTVRFTWRKREETPIRPEDVPGATNNPIGGPITGSPVGGIGKPKSSLPDRADIIVRWVSALPVRHAKAVYRLRDERLDPGKVSDLIPAPESDYVLEIFGLPVEMAHRGTGTLQALLKQSATLRTRTGRTLRPNRVDVSIQALNLLVLVHFPRTTLLELADKEIEVSADLQVFEVREKFRLSPMVYQDHLEI